MEGQRARVPQVGGADDEAQGVEEAEGAGLVGQVEAEHAAATAVEILPGALVVRMVRQAGELHRSDLGLLTQPLGDSPSALALAAKSQADAIEILPAVAAVKVATELNRTALPRIDYLGEIGTGYGNRPYRGSSGLLRLLYSF